MVKLHPLVEEALEAHGGVERWRRYRAISSTIITTGELWRIKKAPLVPGPRRVTVEFWPQRVEVTPFGQPGQTMYWTPKRIEVVNEAGSVIAQREDPLDAIDRAFDAPWDPLSLAYFNGYAMWTYHVVPFVFAEPGYEAREIAPIVSDGETLRGVAVRFPENVHTHARTQRFYFGSDGLLRRHDYEVDVLADVPAAQIVTRYVDVDGLKFPSRRRIYGRRADGTPNLDENYVAIDLSEYVLVEGQSL